MDRYGATKESLDYFKHLADRYRFLVAVTVAALLFVFNQGAQTSFTPTAPETFLVSLLILILGLFLSFAGYSAMNGTVARILKDMAIGRQSTWAVDWRLAANGWVYGIAAFLVNVGIIGLVIHYFFQWFGKNAAAFGA